MVDLQIEGARDLAPTGALGLVVLGEERTILFRVPNPWIEQDEEKTQATRAFYEEYMAVADLPAAVAWMTEQGVRFAPGGIRKGAAGFDICFLHPRSSDEFPIAGEGVLVELVQAPPEVIAAFASLG